MTILALWLAIAGFFGQPTQSAEAAPSINVTIDKVNVEDIAQDQIQLAVSLTLQSATDVAVRQITFEGVQLNGLPLYLAPVQQRIALKSNQPFQLPEPLRVSLYFRDLDSTRPLQTLISERRVRVEGIIYLEAEVPALVRVLLLGRRVHVPIPFQQDIPVNVPEGKITQSIMLGALTMASSLIGSVGSVVESALTRTSVWRDQLWRDVAPRLLLGYTKFALRDRTGQQSVMEFTGAGLRISSNQFVFCKGLVEPWKFDPEVVAAIKRDGLSLVKAEYDISIWPANADLNETTSLKLSKSDFQVVRQPRDDNRGFYTIQENGKPRKVTVHQRDSEANLVLFEFRTPPNTVEEIQPFETATKTWDRVAVFRFPAGVHDKKARPDLVFLPASLANSRIKLSRPVDSSAWGSPVITQQGILGLIQDETTAITLKDAFEALKLKR